MAFYDRYYRQILDIDGLVQEKRNSIAEVTYFLH